MKHHCSAICTYPVGALLLGITTVFAAPTIDPMQLDELEPEGETISNRQQDRFGTWVAVDGDFAIVGTPLDNLDDMMTADDIGSAYVFSSASGTWQQEARLTAMDLTAGDEFGRRVDISGDRAIVGARFHNSDLGAAYIFERNPATGLWDQKARLAVEDNEPTQPDSFGVAVAIDGDTALVGAKGALLESDLGMNATGLAYIFERDAGGLWSTVV